MHDRLQELLTSNMLLVATCVLSAAFVLAIFLISHPLQLFTIARNTFVESVRQPIYFILIMLSGILQIFNVWGSAYSMGYTETAEVSGDNKLLLDVGLATIFVCGTLLAAFVATAVISREIENKTVLTVVSKPVARTSLVLGKFLGVAGAITIAAVTMVFFLLLGIRHGVLSTAADEPDMPVIIFTMLAAGSAIGIAIWCNFFYGWAFTQTATMLMCPFMLVAWIAVLLVAKKWHFQHIHTDFKPQLTIACVSVVLALVVLTSIATAASARLGQVMTIVVCSGVFLFGLLSNHFLGSQAFDNRFVAKIASAAPERSNEASLANTGDTYNLTFVFEPSVKLEPGAAIYYGPNPNGFPLATYSFAPPDRTKLDFSKPASAGVLGVEPALVVVSAQGRQAVIRHVGPDGDIVRYAPRPDDYVFLTPTRINPVAIAAWGVIPNIQFFWLVDAVTQNQPVPFSHAVLIIFYAFAQIGLFLSLAVCLFQTREVG